MAMPTPHTLTITETTEGGVTERSYTVDCPGVTDHCRALRLCEQPGCDLDDLEHDEAEAHGQHHIWIDDADGWYVPTTNCYLVDHDLLPDATESLGLPLGQHLVIPHFGGGYELELTVRPAHDIPA